MLIPYFTSIDIHKQMILFSCVMNMHLLVYSKFVCVGYVSLHIHVTGVYSSYIGIWCVLLLTLCITINEIWSYYTYRLLSKIIYLRIEWFILIRITSCWCGHCTELSTYVVIIRLGIYEIKILRNQKICHISITFKAYKFCRWTDLVLLQLYFSRITCPSKSL